MIDLIVQVGNPCSSHNLHRRDYLHVYPHNPHLYIQCDESESGRVWVRTCPAGLVFDPRFSVCNYPVGVVHFYNHFVAEHTNQHDNRWESHEWDKK